MTNDQSAELRELKKQTRMMARREANRSGGVGFAIGLIAGLGMALAWPSATTAFLAFGLPFVGSFVFYQSTMHRLTKD